MLPSQGSICDGSVRKMRRSYASDYDILLFELISYLLFLWIFALEQKKRQNIAGSVLS